MNGYIIWKKCHYCKKSAPWPYGQGLRGGLVDWQVGKEIVGQSVIGESTSGVASGAGLPCSVQIQVDWEERVGWHYAVVLGDLNVLAVGQEKLIDAGTTDDPRFLIADERHDLVVAAGNLEPRVRNALLYHLAPVRIFVVNMI